MSAFTPEIVPEVTEVTKENFWQLLPNVLLAIAESTFVSIDLEMSGVSLKAQGSPNPKPTLAQAYQTLREAASTYQIFQVGITCARLQPDASPHGDSEAAVSYITETFSFHLTPMVPGHSYLETTMARKLDRKVSFSLNALSFLKRTGFDINKTFAKGIPYLSRTEAREVREFLCKPQHYQHQKQKDGGINIREQSAEAQEFFREQRDKILQWAKHGGEYLNIENPFGGRLTKLQLTILYRIVYNELRELNLRGRIQMNLFFQVERADLEREAEEWAQSLSDREAVVRQQTAFRIVIDALVPHGPGITKELDKKLYELMAQDQDQGPDAIRVAMETIEAAQEVLSGHQPIIVAHNALADLCFLYSTFIGPLPDLETFRHNIAVYFPKLVDTKYLSTRGHHELMPDKNLSELYAEYKGVGGPHMQPAITMKPRRYGRAHAVAHEAGYDSYMTAVVFAKLSFIQAGNPEVLRHIPREDGIALPARRGLGEHSFSEDSLVEQTSQLDLQDIGGGSGNGDNNDQIPEWDSDLFKYFANKTRVGNSGVLRFCLSKK